MRISKDSRVILSLSDWEAHAPPKSPHHWVDGRSAKEVARAWLAGNGLSMPLEVVRAVTAHPSFGHVLSWRGEPEAKLPFDTFHGEPRNSDLAVYANDEFGPYVLAVEAKADESYGETVGEAFAAALERRIKNSRSNGIARIQNLAESLLQPRHGAAPKATALRYQLLTACAGALAEGSRTRCSRVVMLVHEFLTSVTQDANHARNSSDLCAFLTRVSGEDFASVVDGTLYGPFTTRLHSEVQLFIGKVSRNLRTGDA